MLTRNFKTQAECCGFITRFKVSAQLLEGLFFFSMSVLACLHKGLSPSLCPSLKSMNIALSGTELSPTGSRSSPKTCVRELISIVWFFFHPLTPGPWHVLASDPESSGDSHSSLRLWRSCSDSRDSQGGTATGKVAFSCIQPTSSHCVTSDRMQTV